MSAGRLIAYLAAGILLFFGVLFIWGAFSPEAAGKAGGWILIGLVQVAMAFGLIVLASRRRPATAGPSELVQRIDLSGEINLESLSCRQCGGALSARNVQMLAGAPVVTCPYCNASYQLTEEPKW
jgi:hypothetical protein